MNRNKNNLVAGLVLIVIAFICTIVAFYFIGQRQKLHQEKMAALEVELANLVAEKSEPILRQTDAAWVRRGPIALEDFLAHAEVIYGEKELSRKEGVLWIDRKSSTCLVTLGVVNGLGPGSSLGVYQGDSPIGEVVVETAHDIISYVNPVQKSLDDFPNNYYKVMIEE